MSAGNLFLTLVLNRNAFGWDIQKSEYEAISVLEEAKMRKVMLPYCWFSPIVGQHLKNKASDLLFNSPYFSHKLGQKNQPMVHLKVPRR